MNEYSVGNNMSEEKVTKTEFKARALEYFRQVEQLGHTLVVTDRGHPTVEVKRYREDTRTPLERLRGSVVDYQEPTAPVAESDWESAQ